MDNHLISPWWSFTFPVVYFLLPVLVLPETLAEWKQKSFIYKCEPSGPKSKMDKGAEERLVFPVKQHLA